MDVVEYIQDNHETTDGLPPGSAGLARTAFVILSSVSRIFAPSIAYQYTKVQNGGHGHQHMHPGFRLLTYHWTEKRMVWAP